MTAVLSTRRGEFKPTGPVFHIERTRKRKPALNPKEREAKRCHCVTRCEVCLHHLPGIDSNKIVTFVL